MFKKNTDSSFFLLRDEADVQDSSMFPKIGDVAELKLKEKAIDIRAKLISNDGNKWKGVIESYHSKRNVSTIDERLEQIKSDEKYINDNNLQNGALLAFEASNIFGIYRTTIYLDK